MAVGDVYRSSINGRIREVPWSVHDYWECQAAPLFSTSEDISFSCAALILNRFNGLFRLFQTNQVRYISAMVQERTPQFNAAWSEYWILDSGGVAAGVCVPTTASVLMSWEGTDPGGNRIRNWSHIPGYPAAQADGGNLLAGGLAFGNFIVNQWPLQLTNVFGFKFRRVVFSNKFFSFAPITRSYVHRTFSIQRRRRSKVP